MANTRVPPDPFYQLTASLHRGGQWSYYWTRSEARKANGDAKEQLTFWYPAGELGALPDDNGAKGVRHIYFGVHPTEERGTMWQRAKEGERDVVAVNCLFGEFDAKDFGGSKEATLAHIERLEPAASVIIDSGGGYQGYWLLAETFLIQSPEDHARIAHVQAAWVAYIESDGGAKDLCRVLRVPGTINYKAAYGPRFPVVNFHRADLDWKYLLEDLEAFLPVQAGPAPSRASRVSRSYSLTEDIVAAAQAVQRLSAERCNDYDGWLQVGMALKHLGDAGLPIWEEWSQQSDKYQEGDCAAKWNTFDNGVSADKRRVTLASLLHWANEDSPAPNGNHHANGKAESNGNSNAHGHGLTNVLPDDFNLFGYQPEDGGILDAWRDLYALNWRYAVGWDAWLYWTDTHWERDETQQIGRLIHDLLDAMNQEARRLKKEVAGQKRTIAGLGASGDEEIARKAQALGKREKALQNYLVATKRTNGRIASIEGMAQKICAVPANQLNGGDILNLANGLLDLETLTLREHHREDLQTYILNYAYDPNAICPRWLRFLGEVLVNEEDERTPDQQLISLYQEMFGYSLTTETKYEKMAWLAGDGGNGKTVAVKTLKGLLGPLAIPIDFQMLGTPGNYDLANLPGRRVIFSTESERGGQLAEGLIRRIVSGEEIMARAIYGTPFRFNPVAKIWWAMNDIPLVKDTSNATWRRLELIPFNRTFTDDDKDPDLSDKLQEELPGILNWAIEGLQRIRQERRFTAAVAVRAAVDEVRKESNPVAIYLDERTVALPEPETLASEVYDDYKTWCEGDGRHRMNKTNFGREIKRLKVPWKRTMHGIMYAVRLRGALKKEDDPPF